MTQEYLSQTPKAVPPGRIVVHNHVRPQAVLGANGFRAWTDIPNPANYNPITCDCVWVGKFADPFTIA